MAFTVTTSTFLLALVASAAANNVDTSSPRVAKSGRQRQLKFRLERDEWFDAQFTGHPKFACAKTAYPRGERFQEYEYRFLFKTPEAPKSLFCVLQGTASDFQTMVQRVGLNASTRRNRRGGSVLEVTAPEVRCVSRPKLLASLFDFVVVNGRPPHHEAWCLLARAPTPPHAAYAPRFPEPADGALAIRFRDEGVPDALCSPRTLREDDGETEEEGDGAEFFVQGIVESWITSFRCHFLRSENATGPSAHTLLLRVVLHLGLGTGMYRGLPVTWIPAETCREACPDRAPRPDDLMRLTGAYNDDYGVDVSITSPSGRTATCDVPERTVFHSDGPSFVLEAIIPGRPTLLCHSHSLPLGRDVDGTDFYFIVRLDLDFNGASMFRCKMKNGEQLGGDSGVRAIALEMADQMGLRVEHDDVELGRTVPSVRLGISTCEFAPPVGFVHSFEVHGDFEPSTQYCAFGREDGQGQQLTPEVEPTPRPRLPGGRQQYRVNTGSDY